MLCHHASHNGRRWRVGTPNPWQWFLPLPSYPWCDKLKTSLIKTLGDVFDLLGPNHVYHALELSQLALTSCATGCIKSTPTFRPTNDSMDWKALFHRHRFTHTEVSCTRSHHPAVVKIKKHLDYNQSKIENPRFIDPIPIETSIYFEDFGIATLKSSWKPRCRPSLSLSPRYTTRFCVKLQQRSKVKEESQPSHDGRCVPCCILHGCFITKASCACEQRYLMIFAYAKKNVMTVIYIHTIHTIPYHTMQRAGMV